MQNYNSKFKIDIKDRCYKFSLNIIKLIDELPREKSSWIIADQLLRSGMSIGANLVESTASSSRLEFKRYQEIALKSANETKYWLNLLKDSEKVEHATINTYIQEVHELANMIAAGIMKLKGKTKF